LETGGEAIMVDSAAAGPTGLRKLYGGQLCLDFANTVEPREAQPQRDNLRGYADLVRWARHAGALDDPTAGRLLRAAGKRHAEAEASFATAIGLREATFRAFSAIAHGAAPAAADLETLQQTYAEAMRHARLLSAPGELTWAWDDGAPDLDRAWWPMARSAVELATTGPLDRVKQCAGSSGCGFLFFDTSKNRVRRWCSMDECGWQEKARLQTARRRTARARGGAR
jgi:predicted RNA-binding Zn ribbon-like protein